MAFSPTERVDSTGLVQMDLNRQDLLAIPGEGSTSWRYFLGDDLVWASFGPRRRKAETAGRWRRKWTCGGEIRRIHQSLLIETRLEFSG
jgi:hypothetical protein